MKKFLVTSCFFLSFANFATAGPIELDCKIEGHTSVLVIDLESGTLSQKGVTTPAARITAISENFIVAQRAQIDKFAGMDDMPESAFAVSSTWFVSRVTGSVELTTSGRLCRGNVVCIPEQVTGVTTRTQSGFCDSGF